MWRSSSQQDRRPFGGDPTLAIENVSGFGHPKDGTTLITGAVGERVDHGVTDQS
jgi:hypothetical protein